jgi:hypothetical protein
LVGALQGPEPAHEDGDTDDNGESRPVPGEVGAFRGKAFVDGLLLRCHVLTAPVGGEDGADDSDDHHTDG